MMFYAPVSSGACYGLLPSQRAERKAGGRSGITLGLTIGEAAGMKTISIQSLPLADGGDSNSQRAFDFCSCCPCATGDAANDQACATSITASAKVFGAS